MAPFRVVERSGSAAGFHARAVPEQPRPEIWVHHLTAPAVVLGSSQRDDVIDRAACDRAGVEVVRRRSGGGAVLLEPGEIGWLDVIVPRDAQGWHEDIHRPMIWLGRLLASALEEFVPLRVHEGAMRATRWSQLICFDGVGPGELLEGDAKVVGMSQRRTRRAARLQCCWYSSYAPERMVALLAQQHRPAAAELSPVHTLPAGLASTVARRVAALIPAH